MRPIEECEIFVALRKVKLQHYKHAMIESLKDNPYYYMNLLQYKGGTLLRAIVGREILWDTDIEIKWFETLGAYLKMLEIQELYEVGAWQCVARNPNRMRLKGVRWINGVKPDKKLINNSRFVFPYMCKRHNIIYVRKNLVDNPRTADVDMWDWKRKQPLTITMSVLQWFHVKRSFKKLDDRLFYEIDPKWAETVTKSHLRVLD